MSEVLIEIKDLYKSYPDHQAWFFRQPKAVLQGVSLDIFAGECIGIVGESGSGKSTLGKVILGLEGYDRGEIRFSATMQQLPRYQSMSVVFQDYNTSVNPRLSIFEIICEPLLKTALSTPEKQALVDKLLVEVGLTAEFASRFPHQLSGGQLQRVCIARAIAPDPQFILLDEAVSSLDVSVQVQILELLQHLKQSRGMTYLFITHDIAVASFLCDRLLFFKEGNIVEQIDEMSRLSEVKDPYTRSLLEAASYLEMNF